MTSPNRVSADARPNPWPSARAHAATFTAIAAASLAGALIPRLASAATAPNPMAFKGVQLGMSLEAWKALPFPGLAPGRAKPVCTDRPGAAGGLLSTSSAQTPDTVVCAYFSQYGRFTLPEPVALGPRIQAKRLRFTFQAGRLTTIEYRTSADRYDDLTARLNALYGPPTKLIRDTVKTEAGPFPRVRQTWRGPQGQIELVDPVQPYTDLSLRLTSAAGAAHGRAS